MQTSGNTVLITGGGSGIGFALAQAFAEADNTVIICGRDEAKLTRAARDVPGCHAIRCDITSDQDVQHLRSELETRFPSLNMLINNAGLQYNYRLTEEPNALEMIDEEISTNFTAQVKLTVNLLPLLRRQERSALVNITSALSVVPKESAPVYCATKAAMRVFTKAIRYQLEGTSVKVFEVVPPLVDTAMTQGRDVRKVPPARVAQAVLRGLEANKKEIRIAMVKALFAINYVMPGVASSIMRPS
ncbi:SDR family oxidoreductase [Vitiosangium sp. GDMCC 1.1324]|uniref:SDR family oxidoreductase n=1 Tax=Vitiosangium sp. (strain GDMCC 1.1324) TaxID=2138576 RepID=UPI000D3CFB4E|nr:SDR family NAD(P)-dependent oxidoreductase [Vitiosangium sp. GDMCC 1.1324]PTL82106.1 oxidoreductase [Vitiosangium sp. GDMCC 1.1324]